MKFYEVLYVPSEMPEVKFDAFDDMWHCPFIIEEIW